MSSGEEVQPNNSDSAVPVDVRSDISVIAFFADTDVVGAEFSGVKNGEDVIETFRRLVNAGDSRVMKLDVKFPIILNPQVLSIFVRAALWGTDLPGSRTMYIAVVPDDGSVVGIGVPDSIQEIAPGWGTEEPQET